MLKSNILKRRFFQIGGIIFVVSMVLVLFLHYNIERRYQMLFENSSVEISFDSLFSDIKLFDISTVSSLEVGDTAWISNIAVFISGVFIDLGTPVYTSKMGSHSFMIIKSSMGYVVDARYYNGSDVIIFDQNAEFNHSSTEWAKVFNFIWTKM